MVMKIKILNVIYVLTIATINLLKYHQKLKLENLNLHVTKTSINLHQQLKLIVQIYLQHMMLELLVHHIKYFLSNIGH